jgi:uncharacterized membrane protein
LPSLDIKGRVVWCRVVAERFRIVTCYKILLQSEIVPIVLVHRVHFLQRVVHLQVADFAFVMKVSSCKKLMEIPYFLNSYLKAMYRTTVPCMYRYTTL